MKYILRQVLPPDSHEAPIEIVLTEDEVPVGRKNNMILARFPQISRHHATFFKSDNGSLFVKDERSLNGLYVNDEKIGRSLKLLKIGDIISFGVMRDQITVGFVCIVCCDEPPCKIKHEVIEISDDDDDVSNAVPNSTAVPSTSRMLTSMEEKINSSGLPGAAFSSSNNSHMPCSSNNIQNKSFNPTTSKSNDESDMPSPCRSNCNITAPNSSVLNKHIPSNNIQTESFKHGITSSSVPFHSTPKDKKECSSLKFSKRLSSDDSISQNYTTKVLDKNPEFASMSNLRNLTVPSNSKKRNSLSDLSSKSSLKDISSKISSVSNVNMSSVNNVYPSHEQDSISNNKSPSVSSNADVKNGNSSCIPDISSFKLNSSEASCSVIQRTSSERSANLESRFHSSDKNSGAKIIDQKAREISQPHQSSSSNVTGITSHPVTNSDSFKKPPSVKKYVEEGRKRFKSVDASLLNEASSNTTVFKKIRSENSNDFQNNAAVFSTGHNIIERTELIRKCVVPLIRCDSKYFPWPDGVKNPFLEKHKYSIDNIQRITKHVSHSSHTDVKDTSPVSNMSTDNYSNTKYNNLSVQDCKQKRKFSYDSNVEVPDNIPSASKKICFEDRSQRRTVFDDHENYQPKNRPRSESESDNEMNYSQVEDVIYISDDEEYLNLKSELNYVQIKKEPIDYEDDEDIYILDEIDNREDLEFASSSNFIQIKQEKIEMEVETAQPTSAFEIDEENQAKQCYDTSVENIKIKEKTSEFFPVLSQNFESDVEEDNEDDVNEKWKSFEDNSHSKQSIQKSYEKNIVSSKDYEEFETVPETIKNKSKAKSKGKIQLIDPKPMEYRPRKMRGRDEGFVERKKPVAPRKSKKNKDSSKKELLKNKGPFFSDSNLNNFKIPRKHGSEKSSHSSQKEHNDQPPKDNLVSRRPHESAKRTPSVKTRPEKATSRMGFLVDELKINPRSRAVTNPEASKKVEINHRTNKGLNSSASSNIASQSQQKKVLSSSHKAEAAVDTQKKVPVVYNPRDPRQNRIPSSSSETVKQNSIVTSNLPRDGKNIHSKGFPLSSKASENVVTNVNRNADTNQLKSRLIKELIHLNTKWLKEQNKVKHPPDPVSVGADKLPLKYDSYESYVSSFYPMIRLEIWEQMYTESKEVYNINKNYKKFLFSIISYTSKNDYIELECEAVVNDKFCFSPCEGSIVMLDLKDNAKRVSPMFAYVYKHKINILNFNSLKLPPHLWKSALPEPWHRNAKHLTFYAQIKKKEICFAIESLMTGNGLCYIKNKLRLVDALTNLKNSPLLTDILQPNWHTFLVKYTRTPACREYNSGQMELIKGVTTEIPKSENKIMLVQGPPGTGKTHTIIGLIHKLLSMHQYSLRCKILVAAPSNAAIDEIGCRLIDLNERNKSKAPIKFVRVGLEDQMHAQIKPYSLDRMTKSVHSTTISKEKERELRNLKADIARVEKDVFSKDRNENLKYLQDRYKHVSESLHVKPVDYYSDFMQKVDLLKNCHIILSTLSCCGLSVLLRTFNASSGDQFLCCIIDESTQCTELEVFQPLMLNVKKLIMVGDHKQLPATVLSKTACKFGFERSAFERFHTYFDYYVKKTPTYTLTEQFRMHSEICKFPSKYIYEHKLITNPNTDVSYKDFPLLPYMVLDVYVSQEENDSSSKTNSTEAKVIINICTVLLDIVDSASSIGIITPYQAQRLLYINALNVNPRYRDIEVNTVDGFQGREKDIIIVSSVRANSQSGSIGFLACKRRLNVAITRAKKCLIVCGHADSLMKNPDWRELILDAKQRSACFPVKYPEDIPLLFKHYVRKVKARR